VPAYFAPPAAGGQSHTPDLGYITGYARQVTPFDTASGETGPSTAVGVGMDDAALSPDGRYLFTQDYTDGGEIVFDTATGTDLGLVQGFSSSGYADISIFSAATDEGYLSGVGTRWLSAPPCRS
jgi:hypothetical protein